MKANIGKLTMREVESIIRHSMPIQLLPKLYIENRGEVTINA